MTYRAPFLTHLFIHSDDNFSFLFLFCPHFNVNYGVAVSHHLVSYSYLILFFFVCFLSDSQPTQQGWPTSSRIFYKYITTTTIFATKRSLENFG